MSILGQCDRAASQLSFAGELDASLLLTSQVYRQVIDCEKVRRDVFAGERPPLILGEPESWMALLVEARRLLAHGRPQESAELRASALDAAPASAGTLNGEPFQWIADLDSRLGPCMEMVVGGKYYWVPMQRLRELRVEAPVNLRDLVWAPASARWEGGGESTVLLPVRYPGTEEQDDVALRMSRRTEWVEQPGQTFCGLGQRILGTDTTELPLLELRHLVIFPAGGAEPAASAP